MLLLGWNIYSKKKKKSPPSPFSLFPNTGCYSSTLCPRVTSPSQEALVSGSAGISPTFLCETLSLKRETGLRNCSWRMMLECSDGAQNLDRTLITSLLIYFHSQTGTDWGLQTRKHQENEAGKGKAAGMRTPAKPWDIGACARLEGLKTFDHNREHSVSEFSIIPSQLPRCIRLHRKFSSPKKRKAWSRPPNLTVLYFLLCPWGENTETSLQGIVAHKDI